MLAELSLATNIVAEMLAYNIKPEGIVLISPSIMGGTVNMVDIVKPGIDISKMYTDDWDELLPMKLIIFLPNTC